MKMKSWRCSSLLNKKLALPTQQQEEVWCPYSVTRSSLNRCMSTKKIKLPLSSTLTRQTIEKNKVLFTLFMESTRITWK
jgi:hypothetical protein